MSPRILLLGLVLLTLVACEEDDQQLCGGVVFDEELFVQNVLDEMNDPSKTVAGYQFTVNRGGNLYVDTAFGVSVASGDGSGEAAMTPATRMNVASISKFIGTIALMQVLDDRGISIDADIQNYLPPTWASDMHVEHVSDMGPCELTFRRLLRMESCLDFPLPGGTDPTPNPGRMCTTGEMFQAIDAPADVSLNATYQNGNFTLIRVLIGELVYDIDETDPSTSYNLATVDRYFEYITANIFDPAGIDPPSSRSEVDDHYATTNFTNAYGYPYVNGETGWPASNDPTRNPGSGGLVLSALDLAAILAYFQHSEVLVSSGVREVILDNDLGLWATNKYPYKGGTRGPNDDDKAFRTAIMMFPNGTEAVLLVNSDRSDLRSVLETAYDDAWVDPC